MMKGLLVKDFNLMKVQKSYFLVILAVGLGMAVFSDDISFTIGFMISVGSLFTVTSVSYDEFDNGNAFLFSLPITRKGYVFEKYCFGFILIFGSWFISTFIVVVAELIKGLNQPVDIVMIALTILPGMLILLAVMLPVQLKFGGEKGRVAIMGAVGVMFVLGIILVKTVKLLSIDLTIVFNNLLALSIGMLVTSTTIALAIVLLLSMWISISIINKKEF